VMRGCFMGIGSGKAIPAVGVKGCWNPRRELEGIGQPQSRTMEAHSAVLRNLY